ncbi:MAG TPA: hypothetical protein VMV83_14705, partial [Rectinemataceae bacterium]|nr:hypothetical protein [Rectinemataceae bacterium]
AYKMEWVDMIKAGIIDPAKVTRSALQNAASVAALLLTTECAITDLPERSLAERGTAEWSVSPRPPPAAAAAVAWAAWVAWITDRLAA